MLAGLFTARNSILDASEKSSSEERRVNGIIRNRTPDTKKSIPHPPDRIPVVSDSEDDERIMGEQELFRRFYGAAIDRQRSLPKTSSREQDGHPLRIYSEASYPALALASPLQSRIAMQTAIRQAQNSYLNSFDPERLRRARQNEWMWAVWKTNTNGRSSHGPNYRNGTKSSSPFTHAPKKVNVGGDEVKISH